MRALIGICLAIVATRADDRPTFEVASIKPATRQDMGRGLYTYPGGRVVATQCSLNCLLQYIYQVDTYQIVGGPAWMETDRFDLEAKPPATSASSKWVPANFKSAPNPEMRVMLQNLLADRFQLKLHRESRPDRVYALTAAKPKLQEPKSTTTQPFVGFTPDGFRGQNATMDQLVERLASILKRPVLNRTGIDGHFDFYITYPKDDEETDRTVLLMRALRDTAGLKLDTQPGSIDVLVIDHAEKPSGN